MKKEKAKIVCVTSNKGGVGKTFITTNLAGIYSKLGKKVLIIDLDLFFGGIAASLNVDMNKSIYHLTDDFSNNRYKHINDYICIYDENIHILSACRDPRYGNKIEARYIDLILQQVSLLYDVILVDTSHDLGECKLLVMDRSNMVLFVVTNDLLDLKNTKSVMSIFKDAENKDYKILLNNSLWPNKNYYTDYDIKFIIKSQVDYTLSSSFYIKNIDNYISRGKIITLDNPRIIGKKELKKFTNMAKDLIGEGTKKGADK